MRVRNRRLTAFGLASAAALAIAAPTPAALAAGRNAPPERTSIASTTLAETARRVPAGGRWLVSDVALESDGAPAVTLELTRVEAFARGARIRVFGDGDEVLEERAAPEHRYFRGTILGDPAARAMLTVRDSGPTRGLVLRGGRAWVLHGIDAEHERAHGLAVREVDVSRELTGPSAGFECGASGLVPPRGARGALAAPGAAVAAPRVPRGTADHSAVVAIESDYEFYQLLGDATAATDYVGDLFAYASSIYVDEVQTDLVVGDLTLRSTAADPWTEGASTLCGLFEFGRWWNDNRTDVTRTIAHFLSGRSNGGGVAWIGVLCNGPFSIDRGSCTGLNPQVDDYGGAYGYSGDLDGNFDLGNPGIVWDIEVVSHEIGHNFDSPHTHCYGGIGGNGNPVDSCYTGECGGGGCACGGQSLPGPSGQGSGTIMSYCHLLSPGLSNISLTFGTGHPYGTAPTRVATRMREHVVLTATGDPTCLAPLGDPTEIFSDDFDTTQDESSWSGSRS